MKPELHQQFLVDTTACTMTIRREYAAGRPLVWDCHTKSELLDQWFAPKPLTTRTSSMKFCDGGHWHYAMVMPDGQEYWARLDYETVRPIDGYSAFDGFADANGDLNTELPRSRWEVSFKDKGNHTVVETRVQYDSPQALQQVIDMGMEEGLLSTLERLDELLVVLATDAA